MLGWPEGWDTVLDMTAGGKCKLIFTVLIHRHSPEKYDQLREAQWNRTYSTPQARERFRDEFYACCPAAQRYNDIAGYAEIYWDGGNRILAELFF